MNTVSPEGSGSRVSKKKRRRRSRGLRIFGRVVLSLFLIGVLTSFIVGGAFFYYLFNYIDPTVNVNLDDLSQDRTTFIYCKDPDTGEMMELTTLYNVENRVPVRLSQIPENLQNAVIAIEDERFRTHKGVDWKRTIGAALNIFTQSSSYSYGGSTITQQLIKNITQEDQNSINRKLKEIVRALEFEKRYSKDQILEAYLNTMFLSQNCYGVQAAALIYFNKDVSELTLAECASIAGITQYPGKYDPFRNPENNKKKQELVLGKMLELGYISEAEYNQAKAEKLNFVQGNSVSTKAQEKQSYYIDQVIQDVINDLRDRLGYKESVATQMVYSGGLTIEIAIDLDIQAIMDEVFTNEENFPKDKGTEDLEASMIVMDPYTGAIMGMVGGRGEKTADRTLNLATQTFRQPGSCMKPIGVYAPAIEYGIVTSGTVLEDSPYDVAESWPKNYTNVYSGQMSVKKAVAGSVNTIAVKTLALLTPERSFKFLTENLHVTSLIESQTLSDGRVKTDIAISPLSLGGLTKGISVKELTAAYAPFVNRGIYTKPYTYTVVRDHNKNVLLENGTESTPAMSEQTAYIMNSLLYNAVQTGTGTPARLKNMPVSGKTGTTSNDQDRWFVGYTPYYVAGTWVGYKQPREIKVSGTNPAVVLWKAVMEKIHENLEEKDFFETTGVVQASYCADSGMVPTSTCSLDPRGSRVETGWFKKGTEPKQACTVHIPVEIDVESNQIAGPYCPEETRKTVALLNLQREYPVNLKITDSQFIYWPLPGDYVYPVGDVPVYQNLLTPGMFPGYSGLKEGQRAMNHLCQTHLTPPVEEEPVDPELPTDPENPDDGTDPEDPGGTTTNPGGTTTNPPGTTTNPPGTTTNTSGEGVLPTDED